MSESSASLCIESQPTLTVGDELIINLVVDRMVSNPTITCGSNVTLSIIPIKGIYYRNDLFGSEFQARHKISPSDQSGEWACEIYFQDLNWQSIRSSQLPISPNCAQMHRNTTIGEPKYAI